MVLPLLGGAPAVWNTCMVFYQVALLAGYFYAHVVTERTTARTQALLQIALLLAALALLPISVNPAWAPPASSNPIGAVFLVLLVSLGLPFFVVATSSSLLQRWFANLGYENPYVLYAASNLGSLLALVAYPTLIEPRLSVRTQSLAWTAAYVGFGTLIGFCAIAAWRSSLNPKILSSLNPEIQPQEPSSQSLRWLLLAFIPSTLMLSVTTFISMDVAAVPLLWILPLSLYLGTFVLAFGDRWLRPLSLVARLAPLASLLIVGLVLAQNLFLVIATIALHLSAFFLIALACHLELARTRPPVRQLTTFYLWISLGGALGGLFNTLVAPLLFLDATEYPFAAIAALFLVGGLGEWPDTRRKQILAIAGVLLPTVVLAGAIYGVRTFSPRFADSVHVRYALVFGLPLLLTLALIRTPPRMGLSLAGVLFVGVFLRFEGRVPIYVERTFFGEHRVLFTGKARVLQSGTTNHGSQSASPALACEPLSYYSRGGPIGQLFEAILVGPKSRFGVVGLGTASMAAYAHTNQTWTFFEINPEIERIARNPDYFTYLRDCAPQATVVLGDARLSLANVPDASFDVLVLDAFSSDAIPVHLMTSEAVALYFRKLAPGGLLALHISNRYLSLGPVVAAVARHQGLVALMQSHEPTASQRGISEEITPSRWTLVARRTEDFGTIAGDARWQSLEALDGPVWTDDYSNVFAVFRW